MVEEPVACEMWMAALSASVAWVVARCEMEPYCVGSAAGSRCLAMWERSMECAMEVVVSWTMMVRKDLSCRCWRLLLV